MQQKVVNFNLGGHVPWAASTPFGKKQGQKACGHIFQSGGIDHTTRSQKGGTLRIKMSGGQYGEAT